MLPGLHHLHRGSLDVFREVSWGWRSPGTGVVVTQPVTQREEGRVLSCVCVQSSSGLGVAGESRLRPDRPQRELLVGCTLEAHRVVQAEDVLMFGREDGRHVVEFHKYQRVPFCLCHQDVLHQS